MSYILEALKKAQAERQLGETPTIDAPVLDQPAGAGTGTPRKPLVALMAAMGIVIAGLAIVVWRQAAQSPAVPVQAANTVPPAAPAVVPRAAPLPPPPLPPVVQAAPVPKAPPEPAARPAPKPASELPVREQEPVQALADLPEPIQRAIPPLAMSGYMYSSNPQDRLILIDKVLRREGEEVAPGVVLESLERKGAVFAFRGYRYRIPY